MDSYLKLIWKFYKEKNDLDCRDKLITYYTPFIKKLARNIYSKLPNTIQLSEVESFANLGLLDAMEKYNHNRGVEFEAYAKIRIKGAIFDEIRKQDWLPRSIRLLVKSNNNNNNKNNNINHGGVKLEKAEELNPVNLINQNIEGMLPLNMLINESPILPLQNYENDLSKTNYFGETVDFLEELENKISIKSLLLKLNKLDRKVIYYYYFEGRTFKEIGKILKLTESRISQIHKKALNTLRELIGSSL